MNRWLISRLVPLGLILSIVACDSGTSPDVPLVGEVIDPLGDHTRRGADLVSGRIEVSGGSVFITIRWAPGDFIPDTSRVTLHLDTDRNPHTGALGINSTGTVDSEVIGSEFLFRFGPTPFVGTRIARLVFTRPGGWTSSAVECCITYVPDGMDVEFPLDLLGYGEDGVMDFKMVSSLKVSDTGYSGWLDVMPDVGLPATRVKGG